MVGRLRDRVCGAILISPKANRYIRNEGLLKLPSKTTLLHYEGKSIYETGVTPLMKERLREESKHLNDEARLCSLVVDEMAITAKYIYDRNMDCFFGHETAKEDGGKRSDATSVVFANKVLCFMATGLSTSYIIPCGFFFTNRLVGNSFTS